MILEIELGREKVSDQSKKYQEYFSTGDCAKKVLPFFLMILVLFLLPVSCKEDGVLRQFTFAKPMGKVLKESVSEGTRV